MTAALAHRPAPRSSPRSNGAATIAKLNRALVTKRMPSDAKATNVLEFEDDGVSSVTFSSSAAESAVRQGLKASLIEELAEVSSVPPRDLWAFIGLDRTTILRRVARDDALPEEASVKALQFADLFGLAMSVFADAGNASTWLTKPHPALDGETPMQRARTPWGMDRVRSILGALQYGGAV